MYSIVNMFVKLKRIYFMYKQNYIKNLN